MSTPKKPRKRKVAENEKPSDGKPPTPEPITLEKARAILEAAVRDNDCLRSTYGQIVWELGERDCHLVGYFTAEELEALAWWMRNKSK